MRNLLKGRFARRLALSFAFLGLGAAALTALLVNTAFSARFHDYLAQQQQIRQQQLVALFAADYTDNGGWKAQPLSQLAPTVTMSGSEAELRDPAGRHVWSLADADVTPATLAMHRQMMGTGELGPPRALPITVHGTRVGTLEVRVPQGQIPATDQDFRTSVNQLLAAGGLAAGVVALSVGLYLARRATAPIAELTAAANDLAAGHRDRRAAVTTHDEIGDLAASFNTMADRVEKQDELRRLFAADVAHELRTPLAILQTQIEAIQDKIAEPTPETITSLHDESLRLARLVADLETLAAADAAAFTLDVSPLCLAALLRETTAGFADQFTTAGITLRTELDEVTVDGDPVRLRQIVTNLLTNTLKFVPTDATVTVTLRHDAERAELRVTDTGPGIPAGELPHIFDRFYRGTTVRASGSGIGLAVVAELVAAHGGAITADSASGRGATFTITLPTAAARRRPTLAASQASGAAQHHGSGPRTA